MSINAKPVELEAVVVRFSGDSGDGMQLTGTQFSDTSALLGNDVATFPDYPAEIRAPQGTVGGVSGFQTHIGSTQVNTPGDYADVLVAMNPAALKANAKWVKTGGTIIVDIDTFSVKNIERAGCAATVDGDLAAILGDRIKEFNIIEAPITQLTKESLKDLPIDPKSVLRSKNMFALGIVYWLFDKPLNFTEAYIEKKFKKKQVIVEANKRVLSAGFNYAETIEALPAPIKIAPANIKKGTYRSITGNVATAWGLTAAAEKAGLQLFCGSYPITPATDILHELSTLKSLGVKTFQAEDEIAGICTAIGASYAGNLGVTTTSGPGLSLKTEAAGLALIVEMPLVIVNVQRGGPSTGLPTKTEQSDLLQAIHGRHGESPLPVIAASTPSNCFEFAFMASKLAVEYMTPVILLTDGFLGNGSEPMLIPDLDSYPSITPRKASLTNGKYLPYQRDNETLARGWAIPGMEGFEHRVGGLEKMDLTGTVSYVPENHQVMSDYRRKKIQQLENVIPAIEVEGAQEGDLLIVGWGGTYGHLVTALRNICKISDKVGLAHFNYVFPLPKNTREVFSRFKKIVVCELNFGQFADHLRAQIPGFEYLQFNKLQGLPFTVKELEEHFKQIL